MRITKLLALGGLSVAAALLLSVPLKKVVRAQMTKVKPYTIQYRGVATGPGTKVEYSYLIAQNTDGDTMQEDNGDSTCGTSAKQPRGSTFQYHQNTK